MDLFSQLLIKESIGQAIFVLSMVITLGIAFGSISFRGIRLGIAGVLFSGLLMGYFQIHINHDVLHFAREFGLILFVYSIGMEVGPGFFASLKKSGAKLNMIAAVIVLSGAGIAAIYILMGLVPTEVAVGLFSGGTTNTPSLGAAQQTLSMMPDVSSDVKQVPGMAYAIAYPFGIMGIILTMLIVKAFFKVKVDHEEKLHEKFAASQTPRVVSLDFHVENKNLDGKRLGDIEVFKQLGVVVSRVMHQDEISVAHRDTVLHLDDIVHVVGPKDKLKELLVIVGSQSAVNLKEDVSSPVAAIQVIVTNRKIVGKTVNDVHLSGFSEVNLTRITRSGVEFTPTLDMELQYADILMVVGEEKALDRVSEFVGNQPKTLGIPHLIPIFIGIVLGIFIGTLPISLPGVPVPVQLGLAGGPLLAAICLSRLGRIGGVIWYIPKSANFILRELGVALFLACVGLSSGAKFVDTLVAGDGMYWMMLAAIITFAPLMITAVVARIWLKVNYLTLCGLLAGSMTDPPALAFANSQSKSNATSLAYATVYPLVMMLRILSAQLIIIFFMAH